MCRISPPEEFEIHVQVNLGCVDIGVSHQGLHVRDIGSAFYEGCTERMAELVYPDLLAKNLLANMLYFLEKRLPGHAPGPSPCSEEKKWHVFAVESRPHLF